MNTQLIKSVLLTLQASIINIETLLKNEKQSEIDERLGKLLADLLKAPETSKGEMPEAPEEPNCEKAPIMAIIELLEDPRYTLRSFKSITEKTGLSEDYIREALDDNEVDYVVKDKRHSTEQVVGLASRN